MGSKVQSIAPGVKLCSAPSTTASSTVRLPARAATAYCAYIDGEPQPFRNEIDTEQANVRVLGCLIWGALHRWLPSDTVVPRHQECLLARYSVDRGSSVAEGRRLFQEL